MNELAQQIKFILQQYPKHFVAGLGAILLGTGVTAFGVAPLEAQISDLPVQQVVEQVPHAALAAQLSAAPAATGSPAELQAPVPFVLFRTDVTRRNDTVQSLLQRLGVSDSAAQQLGRIGVAAQKLLRGAVAHAQALQQALNGVVAARDVGAKQHEGHRSLQLGGNAGLREQRRVRHRLDHLLHRQVGDFGFQRGHAKGRDAGAEQYGTQTGYEMPGVLLQSELDVLGQFVHSRSTSRPAWGAVRQGPGGGEKGQGTANTVQLKERMISHRQ